MWYELSYCCFCVTFCKFWHLQFFLCSLRLSNTKPHSQVRKQHLFDHPCRQLHCLIPLHCLTSMVAVVRNFLIKYFFQQVLLKKIKKIMGSVCLLRIWGIYLFVLSFPAQNQIVTFLFSLYQILYQKKKKKRGKNIFIWGRDSS